jgi:hypothetical protein
MGGMRHVEREIMIYIYMYRDKEIPCRENIGIDIFIEIKRRRIYDI